MILTLAWKELREHQGIWLTMVLMTVAMGMGLSRLVAANDPALAVAVAALTIVGMATAYGVVCGAMMLAGEHENGTLVFLDIFLGRRGRLWMAKFAIGIVLVLAQALAVGLILRLLDQRPPNWVTTLVGTPIDAGQAGRHMTLDLGIWLLVLPVVALEAYAWGLLGSSLTQRVLAGAALAAVGVTPICLLTIVAPPQVFFPLRLIAMAVVLAISFANFRNQSRELTLGRVLSDNAEGAATAKEQLLRIWDEIRDEDLAEEEPASRFPASEPLTFPAPMADRAKARPLPIEKTPGSPEPAPAASMHEVLWWLTLQQAWQVAWILAAACLLVGFFLPANPQVLWPLATLLVGVVCGTAAFASEQRDLSHQFLSAQHFPLHAIWRHKLLFWLALALLASMFLLLGSLASFGFETFLHIVQPPPIALAPRPGAHFPLESAGAMQEQMGVLLFFGVWLSYGFCAAQLIVWLCRKTMLALLVSLLTAALALWLWLPSLLCGGMSGWQLGVPPLVMLLASGLLMRAWAGGRIKERKPLAALAGFCAAALLWGLPSFGFRAWEVPDVGEPLDVAAFRAHLPVGEKNAAARAIQTAILRFSEGNRQWQDSMAEAARLPVGVLERPRTDGQLAPLPHLPACRLMAEKLLRQAGANEPGPALEQLAQVLALSRNLRNVAPLESYLAGIEEEKDALLGLDQWLARGKPSPQQVRRALEELNRHAAETPPILGCLQAECIGSSGVMLYPQLWSFAVSPSRNRWVAGVITLSLDAPWEEERKTRIWQAVWAGLLRSAQVEPWQLPRPREELQAEKASTRKILQDWIPDAALSRAEMARLLDASWLSDERIFCSLTTLREAAVRAQWRVDSTRLVLALSLYRIDEGRPAPDLQALVPKYLPAGLPTDPYSGQPYRYRIDLEQNPPRGIVWSTGPDRIDHGGHKDGDPFADDDARWSSGDFDLIKSVP